MFSSVFVDVIMIGVPVLFIINCTPTFTVVDFILVYNGNIDRNYTGKYREIFWSVCSLSE